MTIDESEIPRDLESLHEELSGIHIEERPSFAPELEAELREYSVSLLSVRRRQARFRRTVAAAAAVVVLAVGSVPQARAALIRVFGTVRSAEEQAAPEAEVAPSDVPTSFVQFVPLEEEAEPAPATPEKPPVWSDASIDAIRPTIAYPKLKNPEEAERLVAMHYPTRLQERRIGGDVRVMIWVDEEGVARDRQIDEASGERALDRAALNATARLRFEPARRGGKPVGSWVKLTIRFQPPAPSGVFQPRITEGADDDVETSGDGVVDTAGTRPRR